jgi:hypothetical protein
MNAAEPRNPLYLLLLLAGLLFTVTAVAYAVVPVLEEKAAAAGNPAPPSELRSALRARGGTWLLLGTGGLDRARPGEHVDRSPAKLAKAAFYRHNRPGE